MIEYIDFRAVYAFLHTSHLFVVAILLRPTLWPRPFLSTLRQSVLLRILLRKVHTSSPMKQPSIDNFALLF